MPTKELENILRNLPKGNIPSIIAGMSIALRLIAEELETKKAEGEAELALTEMEALPSPGCVVTTDTAIAARLLEAGYLVQLR